MHRALYFLLACLCWHCSTSGPPIPAKEPPLIGTVAQAKDEEPDTHQEASEEIEPTTAPYSLLFSPKLADGFDFSVGDANAEGSYTSQQNGQEYHGWYVATKAGEAYDLGIHPGEDWNGRGGGNTDLGQPVFAIAKGEVMEARDYAPPWGKLVLIRHVYLENGFLDTCYSLYAHLANIEVQPGQLVERRAPIGSIGTADGAHLAHLHLEIRKSIMEGYPANYWPSSHGHDEDWVAAHYEDPSAFIAQHRELLIPAAEAHFLWADKSEYRMHYYRQGKLAERYEIALGQNPIGHKERQGDNRVPEGHYRIIQKSRGPFSGIAGPFFGPAWMRLSYPNAFDAQAGYAKGLINSAERDAIIKATLAGKEPPKHTTLGGGIGIHGWAGEWVANGYQNLTWGCISMHNPDLDSLYDLLPLSTNVIIWP